MLRWNNVLAQWSIGCVTGPAHLLNTDDCIVINLFLTSGLDLQIEQLLLLCVVQRLLSAVDNAWLYFILARSGGSSRWFGNFLNAALFSCVRRWVTFARLNRLTRHLLIVSKACILWVATPFWKLLILFFLLIAASSALTGGRLTPLFLLNQTSNLFTSRSCRGRPQNSRGYALWGLHILE